MIWKKSIKASVVVVVVVAWMILDLRSVERCAVGDVCALTTSKAADTRSPPEYNVNASESYPLGEVHV